MLVFFFRKGDTAIFIASSVSRQAGLDDHISLELLNTALVLTYVFASEDLLMKLVRTGLD